MENNYIEECVPFNQETFDKLVERIKQRKLVFKPLEPFKQEIADYDNISTMHDWYSINMANRGIDGSSS